MLEMMKRRRKELGLSMAALGERIGIGRETIGAIERGKAKGRYGTIARIAEALGLSAFDIRAAQGIESAPVPHNEAIKRDFIPGKLYMIRQKRHGGNRIDEYECDWEEHETFRFIETAGIHHLFRHPIGGWRTSYTDAQLVSVKVTAKGA